MRKNSFTPIKIIPVILSLLFITSCNQPRITGTTPTNDTSVSVATEIFTEATEDVEISKTLTATAIPLAMTVNGRNYPLDDFKQDLLRFMTVYPDMEPQEAFDMLSNDIVEQLILEESAVADGFTISQEELEQRVTDLANEIGGQEALDNWISSNYYNATSFREQLERETAIAFEKEIILSAIDDEMEQAELYQILVYDEGTAKSIQQALLGGSDYFWLAKQYHPATLGYIGWNPQGAMLPAEIEAAAFSMEVGTYSDIIQTDYGYHIIYLNNRDVHPLSPENLLILQEKLLAKWMEEHKQTAAIEIFATYDQ